MQLTRFFNHRDKYPYTQKCSSHGSSKNSHQLDVWSRTKETHEQVAVGEKSSRKTANTIVFLDKTGQKIEGGGYGGGRGNG